MYTAHLEKFMLALIEHISIHILLAISNLNTSRSAWDHLLPVLYLQKIFTCVRIIFFI